MALEAGLHVVVRATHVLAMAVLLGGTAFTWNALRRDADDAFAYVVDYEWFFWGAVGVLLVTGVGNLAAVGAPGPGTRWSAVFVPKLLLVVLLVAGSFPRTLLVLRTRAIDQTSRGRDDVLRRSYAATAWILAAIVVAAVVLVYG